jgi:hypothetical protein
MIAADRKIADYIQPFMSARIRPEATSEFTELQIMMFLNKLTSAAVISAYYPDENPQSVILWAYKQSSSDFSRAAAELRAARADHMRKVLLEETIIDEPYISSPPPLGTYYPGVSLKDPSEPSVRLRDTMHIKVSDGAEEDDPPAEEPVEEEAPPTIRQATRKVTVRRPKPAAEIPVVEEPQPDKVFFYILTLGMAKGPSTITETYRGTWTVPPGATEHEVHDSILQSIQGKYGFVSSATLYWYLTENKPLY